MLEKINPSVLSFGVLLGVSSILGAYGRTAEMGIAVIAGGLGLAFTNIDKFASFKGGGFEAVLREQLVAVIEKETEPEPENAKPESVGGISAEGLGLNDAGYEQVIRTMMNPRYTWRYASGIVKESKVNGEKVNEALSWLESNSLAKSSKGATGRLWSLTQKGRKAFIYLI